MQKRRTHAIKAILILSALLPLFAFSAAEVSAEFYVIAGSRGVGTEIKSLPYEISTPGFYYITKDLSCVAGVHGITITADDVTVDLMGFSLVGPGGTNIYDGMYMSGRANVEIRNGTVRNFQRNGISEASTNGTGHRIVNIRAKDNDSYGVRLYGKGHIVKNCTAVGNGATGIYAGDGSTVTGNTCYDNTGSGVSANYGSTVTGNTCFDNTVYGLYLGDYNLVDQNTTRSNSAGNMNIGINCVLGTNVGAP